MTEAPVVSASAVGNTSFFVSQTVDGCESSKGVVTVSVSNCNLQNGFFVGSGVKMLAFYGNNRHVGWVKICCYFSFSLLFWPKFCPTPTILALLHTFSTPFF